jgi:hypothetical protein
MIPAMIFGSFALLTSLGIPENETTRTREEARVELLGCITRNFLGLENGTSSETFRRVILSRCRPQLPACSTINECYAAGTAKEAPNIAALRPKSPARAVKQWAPRRSARSSPRLAALKLWRSIAAVLKFGNPAPEGRN